MFPRQDQFSRRHIGPSETETQSMLAALRMDNLDQLMNAAIPDSIRTSRASEISEAKTEIDALVELKKIMGENRVLRSLIGMGYSDTVVPAVIQRNILENPGWYTQYTPYQSEISQGRLEALLNFQTMVSDLTGLPVANASLLDEATAAAEAMALAWGAKRTGADSVFFVSELCHPQVIAVVQTRAQPMGIEVVVGHPETYDFDRATFGVLLPYPTTDGRVFDYSKLIERARAAKAMVILDADLLALALLTSPGELGADVAIGSTQRFGVPLGYGGPHAAYIATTETHKRRIPGRIVGVSKDVDGNPAVRLALQTREQHIRRDRATSNICTAQVLLAIMASMYAVYHGPQGIRSIALRLRRMAMSLANGLRELGYDLGEEPFFDTLRVSTGDRRASELLSAALAEGINLRLLDESTVCIALDEVTDEAELNCLLKVFAGDQKVPQLKDPGAGEFSGSLQRQSAYLENPVFHSYHSETEMLRYIKRLEAKDLSLTTSMIPLGSCTMKLNATAEMFPVSWPELNRIHPFVPLDQAKGYGHLIRGLESDLAELTGFDAISLQPNAGSQGEYAGLLVIHRYHQDRGEGHRNVCLIPQSAHGTNPASAAMCGMKVVVVKCDDRGNIDVEDLRRLADQHQDQLAALMVTYPSTHGVFETAIREICEIVHQAGGQVYMDGANLNAQIGLCRPGEYGPDVCHLNLHKTFAIPHGGGGPGMGPIGVKSHLAAYLPSHPVVPCGGEKGVGAISAAPWGSPSILAISWMYVRMLGREGVKRATEIAILNANYITHRLSQHYPVLYTGESGLVAHECIIDIRPLKNDSGIDNEDIAKRLMDYGFHAPTMSFPVAGTLMIEPTESESKAELDRFCDAMISIRQEIAEVADGKMDRQNNPLKNAPHTAQTLTSDSWDRPYSRERAVFPAPWTRVHKFWPPVSRVDGAYGDRNLICTCPSVEAYED